MSGRDIPALFCGSRTLSCVDPRSAMVVMGSFGFVENNGASFEELGLEECKDRRATKFRTRRVCEIGTPTSGGDTDCLDRERSTASTSLSLPHFQLISF